MGRQRVHLSQSIEDALRVGKRKTIKPVILEIDAEEALKLIKPVRRFMLPIIYFLNL